PPSTCLLPQGVTPLLSLPLPAGRTCPHWLPSDQLSPALLGLDRSSQHCFLEPKPDVQESGALLPPVFRAFVWPPCPPVPDAPVVPPGRRYAFLCHQFLALISSPEKHPASASFPTSFLVVVPVPSSPRSISSVADSPTAISPLLLLVVESTE